MILSNKAWFAVTIILQILLSAPMLAATVTWDGGGGNDNWSDPDNWDGDMLPTNTDDVEILNAEVQLYVPATVRSVYLSQAHLLVGGSDGHLIVSGRPNYGIELTSSVLTIKGKSEIKAGYYYGLKIDANSMVEVLDTVEVSEGGIYNQGIVINSASVRILPSLFDSYSIGLDNRGHWENDAGSELRVYGSGALMTEFTGILNSGAFTQLKNRGDIWVEQAYDGIRNSGATFSNWGTIDLHEIRQDGIDNLSSNTSFTNHVGASIISEAASSSIGGFTANIENNATFINNGDIQIVEMSENGVRNLKSFTNNGTITILSSLSLGCIQNDYANADFLNTGSIVINSPTNAISCRGSVFTNASTGDIQLSGSTSAFRTALRIWASATFTNHGSLSLDASNGATYFEVEEGSVFDSDGTVDM